MKRFSLAIYALVSAMCAMPSLLTATAPAQAGDATAYAIRLPVRLAPNAPLQRLVLPAQVLVRLQSPDYADIRLFNAAGQAVPMALAPVAKPVPQEKSVELKAYPILGAASTVSPQGLALRIEERQGQRIVQLNSGPTDPTAPQPSSAQKLLGVLLDARKLEAPVTRMTLDADLPVGQPITLQVQASQDLKNWHTLADTVLYRADGADAASLVNSSVNLSMADLSGHYIRLSWGEAAVTVRSATVFTSHAASAPPLVSARMTTPALSHAHELRFTVPFSTPVAALHITPQGPNVLVPLRVWGRQNPQQPWALLASTVAYRLTTAGKVQTNAPIPLAGVSVHDIKIEADSKTPGFSAPPSISWQFEPVQLVFVASGPGPFVLAAGQSPGADRSAHQASAYLPLASLIPDYQAAQENTFPLAQVDVSSVASTDGSTTATAAAPLVIAQPASDERLPRRSVVLWGILLAGVLGLACMIWVLLKQTRPSSAAKAE